MSHPPASSVSVDSLDAMARAARRWCALVEHPPADPLDALRQLHRALSTLYAAALELELAGSNPGEPDLDALYPVSEERLQAIGDNVESIVGARRWYWVQYDPTIQLHGNGHSTSITSDTPGCGDLVDDMQDIYRDINPALQAWEAGLDRIDAITFDWCGPRFRAHWGIHAT